MKAVLISIKPKYCELIASGKKTVEVRKTKPKLETPFKCYIYCTKQKVNGEILLTYDKKVEGRNRGFRDEGDIPLAGKVIGEFVCDRIIGTCLPDMACLTLEEIEQYAGSRGRGLYAWHISDLVIYDEPKELSQVLYIKQAEKCVNACEHNGMCQYCEEIRPPQSWCYVEVQG